MNQTGYNPFVVTAEMLPLSPTAKLLLKPALPLVSRFLGLTRLADKYDLLKSKGIADCDFAQATLKTLGIDFKIAQNEIERIPAKGPVVVVANHPFGGIEGVILAEILKKVRPDVKVFANFILGRIRELNDIFILVDPFGSNEAAKSNVMPLRDSISWLKNGGMLAAFPSGTVSHLDLKTREVSDPEWNPSIARLIRSSNATVVPIYFDGKNSAGFQAAGLVHPLLRTILLPKQLANKEGLTVKAHIGKPIEPTKLQSFATDDDMLRYLRMRTYIFKNRRPPRFSIRNVIRNRQSELRELEPIQSETSCALLEQDFNQLPVEQLLNETGEFSVAYAYSRQIPHILREIGRLREITFRAANEGTGKSTDLDRFDEHYLHLFVWNHKNRDIVGAYRLAKSDLTLKRFGLKGLYTRTLFHFSSELIDEIGPFLELGRSFIRPEYQRNYWALMLLWKGIGRYVSLHPQYPRLVGPVSINNEYNSASHQLMAAFFKLNMFENPLAKLVRPKNPLRVAPIRGIDKHYLTSVVNNIDEVSDLVDEIEARGQGVPILLKQYLKLGGKLLGFSVDPSFGSVLDGLILVDLTGTEERILKRYLGKEGSQRFLKYHANIEKLDKSA
jgi:putative hemolysin